MTNAIEVTGLRKAYGSVQAVKGIDFYVERGKLFAFLGPNGAGKSTTIDILCTFLRPDAGTVRIGAYRLGEEDRQIRGMIGAVFQDGLLDPLLTVEENLRLRGGFYDLRGRALTQAVEDIMKQVGVSDLRRRPYGKLSGGQRRRCDIARALVHAPEILFLDEPTTGLDPQTRKSVWQTLHGIQREKGMTVFLTTHYMEEAAAADYVLVMDHGEIAAKGTPSQLKDAYARDKLILVCHDTARTAARLREKGLACTETADTLELPLASTLDALPIIQDLREEIRDFEVIRGTMDDAFLEIAGEAIRE